MKQTKRTISKYGGIICGAIYGLVLRLIFNGRGNLRDAFDFNLFSVTFIWIVPVVIGIIPLLFATDEQIKRLRYTMINPALAVLLFFIMALITRIEDIICLVIIAIPFILGAMVGGVIFGLYIQEYRKRKGIIVSVVLLPFLCAAIENGTETPGAIYQVISSIMIRSDIDDVWKNIVRVKLIKQDEYVAGFFNYAGIPRPLYAVLNKDTIGGIRTGHFEGGLVFKETVTKWVRNKEIEFDITVVPASIRQTVFDRHVLKGSHFKFLNAAYRLKRADDRTTELILSSSYELDTKINRFAAFWGHWLLADFQERLLDVIKHRAEKY